MTENARGTGNGVAEGLFLDHVNEATFEEGNAPHAYINTPVSRDLICIDFQCVRPSCQLSDREHFPHNERGKSNAPHE